MHDGPGQQPMGHAGLRGLAGIIVLAFSFPIFFVASYWLDWAAAIVFVLTLVVAIGLLRSGMRHSR